MCFAVALRRCVYVRVRMCEWSASWLEGRRERGISMRACKRDVLSCDAQVGTLPEEARSVNRASKFNSEDDIYKHNPVST